MKKVISVLATVLLIISMVLCTLVSLKSITGRDASVFGLRCFYLVSGSMEPSIPVGAAVIVRKAPSNVYREGDVITFRSYEQAIYGMPNTHRIVGVVEEGGRTLYVTKGDANNHVDMEPVSTEQIYGKVIWNTGSMQWLGTLLGLLTTPMGFMAIIMLPLLGISVVLMRDFTKEYKKALESAAKERIEEEQNE